MPARGNKTSQDAIALLKKDHEKVRGLLGKLEKAKNGSTRQTLLEQITNELKVHTQIEEEIFYPAYKEASETEEQEKLFYEATEEHGVVDMFLPRLEETGAEDETFAAKAKVLKDLVEHHAEEEEKQMFPKARKLMGAQMLRDLGVQLQDRKMELMEGAGRSGSRRRSAA